MEEKIFPLLSKENSYSKNHGLKNTSRNHGFLDPIMPLHLYTSNKQEVLLSAFPKFVRPFGLCKPETLLLQEEGSETGLSKNWPE